VSGLLPQALVEQAAAEVTAAEAGLGFPTPSSPGCNGVALYPRLLEAVAQLLGAAPDGLRLLDSQVPPADAAQAAAPAPMCGSHSMLAPSSAAPEACYAQLFLDAFATMTLRDPSGDEGWAAGEEVTVQGEPGSILFFRSELHQCVSGLTQRVGFRPQHVGWVQGGGAGFGLVVSGMPRDWMASLTVGQRTLLGFPQPGNDYWTDDTINAVSHHYAAAVSGWNGPEGAPPSPMDMTEYIAAKREHAAASLAMTPAVTPGLGRAQLPAVDGAWHFKQEATNWALAEPALPIDADISKPVLSDSQLQQWMEDGYVVVHGMWPQQLIDSAAGQLQATLDAGEELGGFPHRPELDCVNQVILHERIIRAAEQCLGTTDLRFSGGGIMRKNATCFLDLPRTFGLANPKRVTTSDKVHAPAVAGESGERPDFQPGEQGLHQE